MEIIDYLLARKKAGGGSDVTIEQLSVTENGTYSEEGIAYSPVVVNVPAPANSYQLKDAPTGTVSTIDDGTALPMSSLKVGIEPVQDLHGYDHPWAEGAGKNKLQVTATSQTVDGIAFTINNDGTINVNGTATQDISLLLSRKNVSDTPLPEGQLTMTGCPSGGSTSSYYLTCWRTNSGNANDVGDGVTFGYRSDWDFVVSLVIASGTTCNNLIFKPMIRLATETDATFEPYSNICPISGWTAANVTRCGKNLCEIFVDGYVPSISSGGLVQASGSRSDFIPIVPNTRYIFSVTSGATMYIFYYDNDKNFLSYQNGTGIVSYDSPSNSAFAMLRSSELQVSNFDFQFEKGEGTTYEPYNGQTYTIQFRDGDNPLTVYGGTLDVVNGELVVDRASVTLDGTQEIFTNWTTTETSLGWLYRKALVDAFNGVAGGDDLSDLIASTYLPAITYWRAYGGNDDNGISIVPESNAWSLAVRMSKALVPNTESINTYLASNPLTVVCKLAAPITYHLTPTQVRTLVGNNNIWADTGDIIEGSYFKSLT